MNSLNETVALKRWQLLAMLGAAGFALGTILSQTTRALGF